MSSKKKKKKIHDRGQLAIAEKKTSATLTNVKKANFEGSQLAAGKVMV